MPGKTLTVHAHKKLLNGLARIDKRSLKEYIKSYAKAIRFYLLEPCIVASFQKVLSLEADLKTLLNTALDTNNLPNTRKLWTSSGEGKFLDMMRYVLVDYYQTCRKASLLNPNQERPFFYECVVPILLS